MNHTKVTGTKRKSNMTNHAASMADLSTPSGPNQATWLLPAKLQPSQWMAVAVVSAAFLWSFWPTLAWMVRSWESEPDYSHGYLVVPIALAFLWVRRGRFPAEGVQPAVLGGLLLVVAACVFRWGGDRVYLESADGWSMMIWLSGVVALACGWRVLWWTLPSIAFLWFMIPMPFRVETALRQPLQNLATKISCAALQILGWPAIAEANVIRIGDTQFGVEEACSGLRIFVGIGALAFAYLVVVQRSWWIKGLLLVGLIPITLLANCTRIVVTCLLHEAYSSELADKFSHDIAGFVMIPFAAVLFGILLWYLGRLIREEDVQTIGEVVRGGQPAGTSNRGRSMGTAALGQASQQER